MGTSITEDGVCLAEERGELHSCVKCMLLHVIGMALLK